MAKKAACKCKPTECEECPEWIFTFADLVMLMMGFFVILWVLKPAPGKHAAAELDDIELVKFIASIRDYFDFIPDTQNPDKVDLFRLLKKIEEMKPFKGPGNGGKTKDLIQTPPGTDPEPELIRPSKQVGTGAKVLFQPADDKLSPESMHSLDEIALIVKGHRNIFMVKGHASADDYPDGTDEGLKMNLSLRRAQAAADYLIAKGVDRETVRVQGCSTFEPVVQRAYTGDARSLNRRVEVESTGTLVKDLQDNAHGKSPQEEQAASIKEH
ncbi:MAG: OmpA/MotB domain protein [Phycisphaerales bacterium]|nr:OmpA/MotB domain protein [Phycisphaerales bacterium]